MIRDTERIVNEHIMPFPTPVLFPLTLETTHEVTIIIVLFFFYMDGKIERRVAYG